MTKGVYICDTCGALADDPPDICATLRAKWKLALIAVKNILIAVIIARAKWKISSMSAICGRLAPNADVLCAPKSVPGM
jgi:hypothetical protein